jgi:hypothetical protein
LSCNFGLFITERYSFQQAEAEIDTSGDFVRGRFLGLSDAQLRGLPRMNNLHLVIEGRSYRLVSIEDNGTFIAVKEVVISVGAFRHF